MNVPQIRHEMILTNESLRSLGKRCGVVHSTIDSYLAGDTTFPLSARLELWALARDYNLRRGFREIHANVTDYFTLEEIKLMIQVART